MRGLSMERFQIADEPGVAPARSDPNCLSIYTVSGIPVTLNQTICSAAGIFDPSHASRKRSSRFTGASSDGRLNCMLL